MPRVGGGFCPSGVNHPRQDRPQLRLPAIKRTLIAAVAAISATTIGLAIGIDVGTATETTTTQPNKIFVCKYTGTPGVDEVLQGGGNPISIAWQPGREPGGYFNDAQGRSYVLAYDVGQPEPGVGECPAPSGTTTTTTHVDVDDDYYDESVPGPALRAEYSRRDDYDDDSAGHYDHVIDALSQLRPPLQPRLPAPRPRLRRSPSGQQHRSACGSPKIRIEFQNTFPDLAGQTGTLTMRDVNGNVVSTQSLVYQPGTTVDLLYPGTSVNPDGSMDDVPGWILTDDGFWIRDPSDEFLREGIDLEYTVNPTATASVTSHRSHRRAPTRTGPSRHPRPLERFRLPGNEYQAA